MSIKLSDHVVDLKGRDYLPVAPRIAYFREHNPAHSIVTDVTIVDGEPRMVRATICDSEGRPPCRLHGLRMLDPQIFTRLPLASADSTNAAVNSGSVTRFGIYTPATSSQRAAVIADRVEAHNSAPAWDGSPEEAQLELSA